MSIVTQTESTTDVTARPLQGLTMPLGIAGSLILLASAFLSWSYDPDVLGNLTLSGNPGATQRLAIILAVAGLLISLLRGPLSGSLRWFDTTAALRALGYGALAFMGFVILSITLESTGLINVDPGGWVGLVGAGVLALAGYSAADRPHKDPLRFKASGWVEILAINLMLGLGLFVAAYGLYLRFVP